MRYIQSMNFDHALLAPLRRIRWPHPNVLSFGVMLGLLLGVILAVPLSTASLITVGQPSPDTFDAPVSLSFVSDVETRAAIAEAENAVTPSVQTDPEIPVQQRAALADALDSIGRIRRNTSLGEDGQIRAIAALATPPITPTMATTLVQFSNDEWQRVRQETDELFDTILQAHNGAFTEEAIQLIRERELPTAPGLAGVPSEQRPVILHLVGSFLKANSFVDPARTEQRRAEARARVVPVQVSIVRGQNIVRRGDIVTAADLELLTTLGLVRGPGGLVTMIQMLLLGSLTAWLFATYVHYCQDSLWQNSRSLLVVAGLLGVTLLAGRLLLPNWPTAPFAFPFATMAILLTVLFNAPLALIATLAIAPLLGLQHEQGIGLAVPLAMGAAAGIFTAQRARRTAEFAFVGLAVAVITALAACVFWIRPNSEPNIVPQILLFSVVNGALSGILAVGSYHFLGRIAGVVTPLELMELAHPNQPLLHRLMREAPGTYHHSMVVSNLAEVAAEDIGADALLARVGAYYHDVGKMLRPYFFTDNQHDRSNVHDDLDATTSASIIIDHVREGAKLALEAGLPQRIVDFIPQHHGTNLVSYFYQRALQENEDADIENFRYPGPKPQTREAAILMLADGVEATVRAKSQAGKLRPARPDEDGEVRPGQTIADIVEQTFNERIAGNQLDEAPVTLHDISVIKESFIKTLQGIYHPRVDYPQARSRVAGETVATP